MVPNALLFCESNSLVDNWSMAGLLITCFRFYFSKKSMCFWMTSQKSPHLWFPGVTEQGQPEESFSLMEGGGEGRTMGTGRPYNRAQKWQCLALPFRRAPTQEQVCSRKTWSGRGGKSLRSFSIFLLCPLDLPLLWVNVAPVVFKMCWFLSLFSRYSSTMLC